MTAVASALTGIPVRARLAMTGEITLRGRVLAIGGLREKLLAAARAGITTVLLPEQNRKDIAEVPKDIKLSSICPTAKKSFPCMKQCWSVHLRKHTDNI